MTDFVQEYLSLFQTGPCMFRDILIAEDDPSTRMLLAEIFKLRGHRVRTAEDGFAALEAMRVGLPEVLVSDLHMPRMSGFELLSVVRRRLPGVFVVATSAAYHGDTVPEGIAADAFHPKATRVERLVDLVETVEQSVVPKGPRTNASAPIWIAPSTDAITGEDCAMISCPECLRAMPQVVKRDGRGVYVADCGGCRIAVPYAIVKRLNPMTSQPYAN